METLNNQQKIEFFRKVYRALYLLGEIVAGEATPAIASLRLLLIDAVGQEHQSELIGLWNEEIDNI